jgi:hypothetical protein
MPCELIVVVVVCRGVIVDIVNVDLPLRLEMTLYLTETGCLVDGKAWDGQDYILM